MKALARRIQRLQSQLSAQPDLNEYRAICTLYERRRRRFEAEGVPFHEPPPEPHVGPVLPLTPADILRLRREGWRARETRETGLRTAQSPAE